MNFLDIIILLPLIWYGYRGFTRGFVFELSSLISLILGIYLSLQFSDKVASAISTIIDSNYIHIIAFTITFIGVIVLVRIFASFITKLFKLTGLNIINKLGGLIFGTIKTIFLLGTIIKIIDTYNNDMEFIDKSTINESKLYTHLKSASEMIMPIVESQNLTDFIK